MAASSRLDAVYRRFLITKFFTRGWGDPKHLKHIVNLRRSIAKGDKVDDAYFKDVDVSLDVAESVGNSHKVIQGRFVSPATKLLPLDEALFPPESTTCHFQIVSPIESQDPFENGVCFQYAGTGDHFFWRRRHFMALPMIKERNLSSVIIENPFYGLRKPKRQLRSSLMNVTDIFVMGLCLILETLTLWDWIRRRFSSSSCPIVLHGISMGGHMASLSATAVPEAVGLVPCLALSSASVTFTRGVMKTAIPWSLLDAQLKENRGLFEEVYGRELPTAEDMMKAAMDECTHLDNFKRPVAPSLCVAVAAEKDAYQPNRMIKPFPDIWPGAEIRYLEGAGHVSSYLFKQGQFRRVIYEVLERLKAKQY